MNSTLKSCIRALTGLLIFFAISGESAHAQSLRFEVSQRTVLPLKTPLRITLNNPIPQGIPCSLQIVELNGNVIKDVAGIAGNTYIDIPLTTGIGAFGVYANSVVITDGRYIFRLVTKYPSRINDVVFKEVLWEEPFNVSSNINFTNANLLNKSFIPTPEPEDQYRNLYVEKTIYPKGAVPMVVVGLLATVVGISMAQDAYADGVWTVGEGDEMTPEDEAVFTIMLGTISFVSGLIWASKGKREKSVFSDDNKKHNDGVRKKWSNRNKFARETLSREQEQVRNSVRMTLTPVADKPLRLQITNLIFVEPSGDKYLDAMETGQIEFEVTNEGPGKAYDVQAILSPKQIPGITYEISKPVGNIPPKEARKVSFDLVALKSVPDAVNTLTLLLKEYNGFDSDAVRITFDSKKFTAPLFILEESRLEDDNNNNRIDQAELVTITSRLKNIGGKVNSPEVQVVVGNNVILTDMEKKLYRLGRIDTNEIVDIRFSFYTNRRAKVIGAELHVTDVTSGYSAIIKVPLKLNVAMPQIRDYAVLPERDRAARSVLSLNSDVDVNISKSKNSNKYSVAVILGVENYQSLPKVDYVERDVTTFREYANQILGVPDDNNHMIFQINENLTRSYFDKLFAGDGILDRRVNPDSDVFVYFAGHGFQDEDRNAYLMPYDADKNYVVQTGYSVSLLYEKLSDIAERVNSITIFIDACFSGRTRDSPPLIAGRAIFPRATVGMLSPSNVASLNAASDSEVSNSYPEQRHGLFTYYLLKGLKGDADANRDRKLGLLELRDYLVKEVRTQAGLMDRNQTPSLIGGKSDRILVQY